MKKLALTGIATLAIAAGAFAQGLVAIDDSANANGVADLTAGSYYNGPFGMEVWGMAGSTLPSGINGATTWSQVQSAYSTISASPWTMAGEYNGTMSAGAFSVGTATLPASPAGSSVVIALAVWNNSATSWAAGTSVATTDHAGILAFVNPTVAPGSPPPTPASLSGWTSGDLVMTAVTTTVPEPGTLALAGLGLASLLVLRRRK